MKGPRFFRSLLRKGTRDSGLSSGKPCLVFPRRLHAVEHNPALFLYRAQDRGVTRITLCLDFKDDESTEGAVVCSFRRTATTAVGWPGIESKLSPLLTLFYEPGTTGKYLFVPSRAGRALRAPPGCPENHAERVLAAFLCSNQEYFAGETSGGDRYRVRTRMTDGGKPVKPPRWRDLIKLAEGRRRQALDVIDLESLQEAFEILAKSPATRRASSLDGTRQGRGGTSSRAHPPCT